jgi:hypothetical protein
MAVCPAPILGAGNDCSFPTHPVAQYAMLSFERCIEEGLDFKSAPQVLWHKIAPPDQPTQFCAG